MNGLFRGLIKSSGLIRTGFNNSHQLRFNSVFHLNRTVNYEEFEELRRDNSAILIDVRYPNELKENGSIVGTVNIPLFKIKDSFNGKNPNFHIPKYDEPIVFFCAVGKRSAEAEEIIRHLGYTNTANYVGSYNEWAEKHHSDW